MRVKVGTYCTHKGRIGKGACLTMEFTTYCYWQPLRKGAEMIFCSKEKLFPLTEQEQLKVAVKYGF